MDSQQVLQYLKRLPGVTGGFISNASQQVIASDVPLTFDETMLSGMALDGSNALETLRSEQPDFDELRIDFDLMTVLIRDLDGDLLFVLIDQKDEISSIRIAANVVSKRYQKGSGISGASSESSASPLGGGGLSLSLGKQPMPEKPEKKKSGGSIWG